MAENVVFRFKRLEYVIRIFFIDMTWVFLQSEISTKIFIAY